uniref:Uncharacterized protein n=1 Tax=Anguilla anguilla TaxID=7936 RepID=A0A0E9S1L7_ANGAN
MLLNDKEGAMNTNENSSFRFLFSLMKKLLQCIIMLAL